MIMCVGVYPCKLSLLYGIFFLTLIAVCGPSPLAAWNTCKTWIQKWHQAAKTKLVYKQDLQLCTTCTFTNCYCHSQMYMYESRACHAWAWSRTPYKRHACALCALQTAFALVQLIQWTPQHQKLSWIIGSAAVGWRSLIHRLVSLHLLGCSHAHGLLDIGPAACSKRVGSSRKWAHMAFATALSLVSVGKRQNVFTALAFWGTWTNGLLNIETRGAQIATGNWTIICANVGLEYRHPCFCSKWQPFFLHVRNDGERIVAAKTRQHPLHLRCCQIIFCVRGWPLQFPIVKSSNQTSEWMQEAQAHDWAQKISN